MLLMVYWEGVSCQCLMGRESLDGTGLQTGLEVGILLCSSAPESRIGRFCMCMLSR